jgi:hypothetical protein
MVWNALDTVLRTPDGDSVTIRELSGGGAVLLIFLRHLA